jgi:hypothetical protein
VTCILDVSKWRRSCLQQGDGGVEITCLYMVILAAPVTNRRWIGSVIGLDLVEGGGITCAGRSVGGVASRWVMTNDGAIGQQF